MRHLLQISFLLFFMGYSFNLDAQTETSVVKGDTSPLWQLMRQDSSQLLLEDVDADYILLFFWHYSCSHCQLALTKIDKFLAEEKPERFKIVSIYPFAEDRTGFFNYVNDPENLLTDSTFIHTIDHKATTRRAFSMKGAPPLLILMNKEGKILAINFKATKLKDEWRRRAE